MIRRFRRVQPAMSYAIAHLDEELPLAELAARCGLSPYHFHRTFQAATGETTKQFTSRLRLARATAMLLSQREPILNIALSCGFQSHEAFCRAFQKSFGMTPSAYRKRALASGIRAEQAAMHAALISRVSPCIRLVHIRDNKPSKAVSMTYTIGTKNIAPQPALLIRRRVKPSEIAATLAELFGRIFVHIQNNGGTISGQPFMHYIEWGPGLLTIEAGLPVASAIPGDGDIVMDSLPGGLVATTTHIGPYELLSQAHAAVQVWIHENGHQPAGSPWEVYVTDPADYPDPKDWKTDVFWPLAS